MPTHVSILQSAHTEHPYLLDTSSVVSLEPSIYPVRGWFNVSKLLTIHLFGFGAHSRHGEELLILLDTLL